MHRQLATTLWHMGHQDKLSRDDFCHLCIQQTLDRDGSGVHLQLELGWVLPQHGERDQSNQSM